MPHARAPSTRHTIGKARVTKDTDTPTPDIPESTLWVECRGDLTMEEVGVGSLLVERGGREEASARDQTELSLFKSINAVLNTPQRT